ncbi:hypothetical protein SAMN05421679_101518 [Epilithonimonas pallida]|uniref:Uncharacterized protein n=1 Tax=Epilithonimonas pallida TaxID=373671 RepID=A0ABY1QYN9_9FLAO|nr:hypothetical protein SAMN05421679_101518 [Epilithonimonas pallida]
MGVGYVLFVFQGLPEPLLANESYKPTLSLFLYISLLGLE